MDKLESHSNMHSNDILNIYATILNSAFNAVVAIDTETRVFFMNKAAEELIGFKMPKNEDVMISSIIPTAELPRVLVTGVAESGLKSKVSGKDVIATRSPIWVNGKIIGAVSVFQDISDLEFVANNAEITRKTNDQLNTIIDSMYDGLIIADDQGKIIRVNKSYEAIADIKSSEYVGKLAPQLVKEGYVSESVTMKVVETERQANLSITVKTGRDLFHSAVPIFNQHGKLDSVVTVIRDLTELNQLKRRLEETEAEKILYQDKLKKIQQRNGQVDLINFSHKMKELFLLAEQVSQFDTTILITGESGVGKEVIARFIHENSKRKSMPYIRVNCGAIPENLLESELFGYEKGAFTGAAQNGKTGLLDEAKNGSFLLDEISELPFSLQVKLLRVLQEREFIRVGGKKPIKCNIRFIATSNRNLLEMVKINKFRIDLYYRLNVVQLDIPPLRDRKEEIPAFVKLFLNNFNQKYDQHKSISSRGVKLLTELDWLGNIRELENTIERLAVTSQEELIRRDHLSYCELVNTDVNTEINNDHKQSKTSLKEKIDSLEKETISQAIDCSANTREAAKYLDISQSSIVKKMKKYGLKSKNKSSNSRSTRKHPNSVEF